VPQFEVDRSFTIASSTQNEFDPNVRVANGGNFAVSYTYQYSTADLDVKVGVVRNNALSTYTIANSTLNETNSIVESFNGTSSLTVSWLVSGTRQRRTLLI